MISGYRNIPKAHRARDNHLPKESGSESGKYTTV